MTSALIGYTGFVGSNLLRQGHYDELYNSKNIEEIRGRSFDRVVCAGATGAKWIANRYPKDDAEAISRLIRCLSEVRANSFVLISTVDVEAGNAYGRNRLMLEQFGSWRFKRSNVIRLPALFGPGLKKNALFDLIHDNGTELIHPDSEYQWYPLNWLTKDIDRIAGIGWVDVANLVSEPIAMRDVRDRFFPGKEIGSRAKRPVRYDVKFGENGPWVSAYPSHQYWTYGSYALEEMAKFLETETV